MYSWIGQKLRQSMPEDRALKAGGEGNTKFIAPQNITLDRRIE